MYITSEELAEALNFELVYLFKVLNKCGFDKSTSYSLEDLRDFSDCIRKKHYRKKLLAVRIDTVIFHLECKKV